MGNDSGKNGGALGRAEPSEPLPAGPESAARPARDLPTLGDTPKGIASGAALESPRGITTGTTLADGRFRLRRRLGEGGMGVVYEAFDSVQCGAVALKTLSHMDPSSLYFLKNEFRSLADVVHPNLVGLHGLFSDGDRWFVTMELVIGAPFVEHVRGEPAGYAADQPTIRVQESADTPLEARLGVLRRAMRQLALGVSAIHAAGRVHRDLKPSNVLVTAAERVVILDFGLAAEVEHEAIGQTIQGGIIGTPVYMAPEQLIGLPASPASDWYAIGVMLFQALTGKLPFDGRFHEVFAAKQLPPPHPRAHAADVPEDLDELCVALLARESGDRPSGVRVLDWLTAAGAGPASSLAPESVAFLGRTETPFVGRSKELAILQAALAATETGQAAAVLVSGPSGMGKTALVERFLSSLRDRGNAVVLSGRCYERESVAFKALDALIDSLTRYLRRVTAPEAFLPRDVRALVRVFPVLERVEAIAESPQRRALPADPQELRRRAFGALREMLGRVADRSPLVVFVDDLQWGDVDSAQVIREILAPPDPPAMLFVGTCRSDERGASPCLRAMLDEPLGGPSIQWVELPVGTLGDGEAAELATRLLGDGAAVADTVRKEGRGSPFFITELVRYLEQRVSSDDPSSAALSLDRALARRVSMLTAAAQRVLEVVSVAARPLTAPLIASASALGADAHAALRDLTTVKLARRVGPDDAGEFTTYHDRIREAVAGRLDPARLRAIHLSLADALERAGSGDLEAITDHLLAAGERVRAADYAVRAAELARGALAFDRAAGLYGVALENGQLSPERVLEVRTLLGDVLVDAGRSTEAAHVFMEVASLASGATANVLRRRAGEQLILAGHLDAGLGMLRDTASALGLGLPSSGEEAEALLFGEYATLQGRGLDFEPRDESTTSDDARSRVDLAGSLALAQLTVDTAEGTLFTLRHLLAALSLGDERRVQRALALFAFCTGGILPADGVSERVDALASELGTAEASAWVHMTRAILPYWRGEFGLAAEEFERAETVFRDECHGLARELGAARLMLSSALWHAEEVARVSSYQAKCLTDARERKDLYLVTWCYVRAHYTRLAEDQAQLGWDEVEEAVHRWGRARMDFIAWQSALAFSMIDRYRGATGLPYITARWSEMQANAGFSQCPVHLALTRRERAFAALATASRTGAGTDQAEMLRVAEHDAEVVAGTGILGGPGFLDLARGAIANVRGDTDAALAHVSRASDHYAGLGLYSLTAALLRRQRGLLVGGDEGQALVTDAERAMAENGVRNVERWARTFLPGF